MAEGIDERPRLALHVSARRHIVGRETHIVLHDRRSDRRVQVGEREWAVLRCADGTRDIDGLLLAAKQRGRHVRRDHLEAFLRTLDEAGMLDAGVSDVDEEDARTKGTGGPAIEAREMAARYEARKERLIDVLPGYLFECDGSGGCCRVFPTILFSPEEALTARATAPELLDGGQREELVFTPERSASFDGDRSSRGARAVTLLDGACAYVSEDLRCLLHKRAGPLAKPLGCRLFPTDFVDDGEAIRVSILPDCACVFESLGKSGGEPLVAPAVRTGADLPPAVHVPLLSEKLFVDDEASVARGEYVAWSRRILALSRKQNTPNVASTLWSLAGIIAREGLDHEACTKAVYEPEGPDLGLLLDWMDAVRSFVARRSAEQANWRGDRDLLRAVTRWLQTGAERFVREPRRWLENEIPSVRRNEAFYLETILHGHQLVDERPLVTSLRDRAIRLLLARTLPQVMDRAEVGPEHGRALGQPIALVEPLMRTHGFADYSAEVANGG